MYLIGLTGGIAAGKSTVAARWVQLGAIEIDADQLARDVVAPGTEGLQEVAHTFGASVLNPDATLNRQALGSVVFDDPIERKKLEAIIHPRVKALARKLLSQMPSNSIVVYNVPLLVEASVDLDFDKVVTVEAPADKQVERLVQFRGMSKDDAAQRVAAQASAAQRANVADVILNSNQDLALLLRDADLLWRSIVAEAQAKFENTEH